MIFSSRAILETDKKYVKNIENPALQGGFSIMQKRFLLCGFTGWCLEVMWTGLHALLRGDSTMMGKTSLLMFPIYGCAAFIGPLYQKIKLFPAVFRGSLYTIGIYLAEFISGSFLKRFHMCPWDYSNASHQYKGIIRLDYVPVWFATGMLYEKILKKSS